MGVFLWARFPCRACWHLMTAGRLSDVMVTRKNHPWETVIYFTEMCSGSEAGSHLRLIDFRITQL